MSRWALSGHWLCIYKESGRPEFYPPYFCHHRGLGHRVQGRGILTISFLICENGDYICPTYITELQLIGHLHQGSDRQQYASVYKGDIRIFSGTRERASTKAETDIAWEKRWKKLANLELEKAGKGKKNQGGGGLILVTPPMGHR